MLKKSALILFLMFLAVYVAPLAFRPMVQPDETRYAEVAREMLQSGDFITPRLNGIRYFEKPVMGYWLFAGSMRLFGENAFALRLPCALMAGLAAFSLFLLVYRFGGGYLPALITAAVYLTMPFVFALANLAILDSILTGFLTAGLCLIFFALMEDRFNFWKVLYLLGFGAMCGCAFMTKGFLAFAVPGLTVAAFLCWTRRWTDLLILPWIPLFAVVAVCLPWALAINAVEPGYWHYFFWVEHINRFFSQEAAQHSEPFYYFIPVLIGGAALWTLLVPSCAAGLKETGFKSPLVKYCVCWLVLPFVFFSFSSGKLAPYILPCFAPLSVLVAVGLHKCRVMGRTKEFQLAIWSLAGLLAVALVLFAANQLSGFPATLFRAGETYKWILGWLALAIWLLALIFALGEKDFWRKLVLFCLGPAPLLFVVNFIMPDMIVERKAPLVFLEKCEALIPEGATLVSWRDPAQSVCWAFKRKDVWLYLSGGEMDDGLRSPDSAHRLLSKEALIELINKKRGLNGLVLVVPNKFLDYEEMSGLPKPEWSKSDGGKYGYAILKY